VFGARVSMLIPVYHSLGIDHDLFTPIFAVSRMSGWIAHILEQYDNNRLIRPRLKILSKL
jgi:citrate synthase